jgi:hypothetical protein
MQIRVTSRWAGLTLSTVLAVAFTALPGWAKPPKSDSSAPSIKGRYAFRMTPAKSFAADAPADPGGLAGAPRQDLLRVGFFVADGAGGLTGHTIATTDTNTGKTLVVTFDWAGKYIVNADGTGFFSVDTVSNMMCADMTVAHSGQTPHPAAAGGTPLLSTTCPTGAAIEGHEDYAFVFTNVGGKALQFIETDNDGGGAKIFLTGTAHRQENPGNGNDSGNDQ